MRANPLAVAAAAYVAANLLHGLDHQRQGTARLADEVIAGGAVLTVLALVALVLAVRRHPWAPAIAAVVGLSSAAGVAASHLAPHWSAFSDPYPELPVDALSWVVVLAEIGTAAALGIVGLRELLRARARASAPPARPA